MLLNTIAAAFVTFVKNLFEEHQRDQTFEQTYRILNALLAAWERDPVNAKPIPGYARPPKRGPITRMPAGWSRSSLRKLLGNKYERTLRKQGPKAASELLPSIRTSPSNQPPNSPPPTPAGRRWSTCSR